MKGADAHRQQPSGGPSSGSDGGGSGGGGSSSPASNGESAATGTPDVEAGEGGRFSLDQSTKRKLVIGGGVAVGAIAVYFLLKNRSTDRGGGRRPPDDDGGDGGDGGVPEGAGYPNIDKTPEDPLAADEEAIEWIKNPEEKAREVARDEMEEEELIE
jgi:hypothetical protein